MKPLKVWTCQRAENLKKKSSKIPKNNYAATMVSAARRQIITHGSNYHTAIMCTYSYTRMHIGTQKHILTHKHTPAHTHTNSHTNTHTKSRIQTHTNIHIETHKQTSTQTHTYKHKH